MEREKLKGCNKGFRASKQIAVKAARGRGEEGKGWRKGVVVLPLLLVVVSFEEGEMVWERERRRRIE